MRLIRIAGAAVVLIAVPCRGQAAGAGDGRELLSLDRGWRFLAGDDLHAAEPGLDDRAWQPVDLPHTWNALDGQDGGGDYRRGPGWYRRHLPLDGSYAGRRLYLQFDGASLMTDVYVNGIHLGKHEGGFARFRFDATEALRPGADNVVAVRVDNGRLGFPPTSADFTFFGGLYRSVWLLATDPVQISAMDLGSPGVFVEQSRVDPASATVVVRAELENRGPAPREVVVRISVLAPAAARPVLAVPDFRTHLDPKASVEVAKALTLDRPHLWNARAGPFLYTVRVELRPDAPDGAPGGVSDAVEQPLGLRSYSVDPQRGFILNGAYLDLYGFNRHQDWPDRGWAISDAEEARDFALMQEVGATAVRASHYQQSDSWYARCDRSGIVAWAEIPFVNEALDTPEFAENAKQQLRELIRQNFNHPSICFWGVGNETSGPAADGVITALAALARAEDPGRLSTYASNHDDADPRNARTDVVGFNRYYGWYRGTIADFAAWLDRTHADYPRLHFAMSEYGAGASIFQHAENPAPPEPRGRFHPEEYQDALHEAYWAELKARPYVWAKFIWCLHDFASDGRDEGDHPGRNDKGVVTYDRRTMKDAFYFYQANWSLAPVLHVASSRFDHRTDPRTEVKVYSNAHRVSLEVNGADLGSRDDPGADRIFRWPGVRLVPGSNRVVVRGDFATGARSDSCVWTLEAP